MKLFKLLLRLALWCALTGILMGGAALSGAYLYIRGSLPKIDTLADYRPPIITRVFADDNSLIAEFAAERRVVVPYEQMPQQLVQAFLSAEDSNFFRHHGIDFTSILRAALKNLKAGGIVQGGSTITQQVAKTFLLNPEKKFSRKFKEAILSWRIESSFSKEEILYLYLNQIYLGHAAYGVQAAAENYFDKDVNQLTLAECAMMAGLPQAPSRYSPYTNYDRAKERQRYVLARMVKEGYIDEAQQEAAFAEVLTIHKRVSYRYTDNAYFSEQVRRYLEDNFSAEVLYNEGLQVQTSLNLKLQQAAQQAVQQNLREHDRRHGYRGATQVLPAAEIDAFLAAQTAGMTQPPAPGAVVTGVVVGGGAVYEVAIGHWRGSFDPKAEENAWAAPFQAAKSGAASGNGNGGVTRLPTGSVVEVRVLPSDGRERLRLTLEQEPAAQGALVAMDPHSGHIRAMVGGYDFSKSQYNRAIQARRLPGSAIKPLVYAAALDKGYTPASVIMDTPLIYEELKEQTGQIVAWKPRNYEERFYGPTRFREALAHSRNVITVKILEDIGVAYAASYAHKLGIESPLPRDLTFALGSASLTPLELTTAYCTFANGGVRVHPAYITRILDRDGKVLHSTDPADFPNGSEPDQKLIAETPRRVITPETAYLVTNLMESVIQHGTGQRAKVLGRPLAGKTGTTNDLKDAWFIGYAPQLVAAAWVGHDMSEELGRGETGARAALPGWISFMRGALEGEPALDFPVPDGIEFHPIDRETGLRVDPAETSSAYIEAFAPGTAPPAFAERMEQPKARDFFRLDLEESF